jgi:hypothetical protein
MCVIVGTNSVCDSSATGTCQNYIIPILRGQFIATIGEFRLSNPELENQEICVPSST